MGILQELFSEAVDDGEVMTDLAIGGGESSLWTPDSGASESKPEPITSEDAE